MGRKNRNIYPLELIKTGCYFLNYTRQNPKAYETEKIPIRSLLVYCIEKTGDGWLPINRDYKPIGLHGYRCWADYNAYPFLLIPDALIDFKYLESLDEQKGTGNYYVFSDVSYPRGTLKNNYIEKVQGIFFGGRSILHEN